MSSMDVVQTERAIEIARRVEEFVRTVVIPYERDPRCGSHGPSEELVRELRGKARAAGVLTPHILAGWRASHAARNGNRSEAIGLVAAWPGGREYRRAG